MNNQNNASINRHLLVLYALSLFAVVGLVAIATRPTVSEMMANHQMNQVMHSMMGTTDENNLKIVKPADRVNQLQPTSASDGTKEFTLTAEPIRWEYANGKTITAWGYNGQIPGPEIRVTAGDRVRIQFTNNLPKATTIHWHGIAVPNDQDGIPGVTQKAIQPGESYTYEFTATPAGTRFYHTHGSSHTDEAQQMDMGLSGAFIIEPKDFQKSDVDGTLILDEWQTDGQGNNMSMMDMEHGGRQMMDDNVFTINGRAFPDTTPIQVKAGQRVRLRLINAGSSTTHPMHLHGHSFKIVAVDGNPVPEAAQLTRDTITVAPGERYDIEFIANNPGAWLLHCHELHHADAGMILPLLYDGFSLPSVDNDDSSTEDDNTIMHKI